MPHQNVLTNQTTLSVDRIYCEIVETQVFLNKAYIHIGSFCIRTGDLFRFRKDRRGVEAKSLRSILKKESGHDKYKLFVKIAEFLEEEIIQIQARTEQSCGGRIIAKGNLIRLIKKLDDSLIDNLIKDTSTLSKESARAKIIADLMNWNFNRQLCSSNYSPEQIRKLLRHNLESTKLELVPQDHNAEDEVPILPYSKVI